MHCGSDKHKKMFERKAERAKSLTCHMLQLTRVLLKRIQFKNEGQQLVSKINSFFFLLFARGFNHKRPPLSDRVSTG